MHLHATYYAKHPLLVGSQGELTDEDTIFAVAFSSLDYAPSVKDNGRIQAVAAEALRIADNFTHASFFCILALSSVLGMQLESYFPSEDDLEDVPSKYREMLFNGTVSPRTIPFQKKKVHLFHCSATPLDFVSTSSVNARKDHFVPLMSGRLPDAEVIIPPSFNVVRENTLNNLDLETVPSGASSVANKKRKLTIIDHFQLKASKCNHLQSTSSSIPNSLPSMPLNISHTVRSLPSVSTNNFNATASSNQQQHDETEPSFAVLSHQMDIGGFCGESRSLSDEKKLDLLCNHWKPNPSYVFPSNSYGRKFQYKWFTEFSWLAYSVIFEGAFCINCILFAADESSRNACKLDQLYTSPFKAWSKGLQKFRDHDQKSPMHRTATVRAVHLRQRMEQNVLPINVQVNRAINEQVLKNREKLKPIVEAVLLCGRQNIPLRGHRDDSKHYEDDKVNPGNFQEILKFLGRCGKNTVFEEHMANAAKTATYRSKTTQNELVNICGELILSKLTAEIKESKFFAILADEAADVSNIEQMPLVIRFVDHSSIIREEFLGFVKCDEGMTGEAISKKILGGIREYGLDMKYCRGQGYDGAGNMAGKCSGAAVRIQNEYPKAPYTHCGSHALNLCVASACNIQEVRNMMSHVRVVSEFFNASPKRFAFLTKEIKNTEEIEEGRHTHLIDVCRTRWIARIDGLDVFAEVFLAVVKCLEKIKLNVEGPWNTDSVRDASGLFHATISFQFIVCLIVVSRCLEITRPLTKQLQSATYDIVAANENVTLLYAALRRARLEVSEKHAEWFEESTRLAQSVKVDARKPRTVGRQVNRANTPADSISQYYERTITIRFLDHLTWQIKARFSERNMTVLNGFYAFPARIVSSLGWRPKFESFLKDCSEDLPEARYLSTELSMWEDYWRSFQGTQPTTLSSLLPSINRITFPNIFTAMQILATLPVTTCTCERSISVLRRLKTYLRNSMAEDRLNALALLHVHREIKLESEDIIDRFALRHPRRMKLIDILNTDP